MSLASRLRVVAPVLALVLVAANQIRLARATPLSPWKGGGFGMFSTTDSPGARRLRVVVHAADGTREVEIPERLVKLAAKAVVLPDRSRLERLARALVRLEQRTGAEIDRIEIEVHGRRYAPATLLATEFHLARHEHRPVSSGGDAR